MRSRTRNGAALQVLNTILKRSMDGLNMQLVGRNMYDADSPIHIIIQNWSVDWWGSSVQSDRGSWHSQIAFQDVSPQFVSTNTISLFAVKFHIKERSKSKLVDSAEISDVDYFKTPMNTFDQRGTPTSFYDYYCQRYHLEIRDRQQHLLILKSKATDIRDNHIRLISELCKSF